MKNGKMEPWNWGHEGWLNERADGHVTSPVKDNLVFAVQPWTPSTKGTVTAQAVNLIVPNGAPARGSQRVLQRRRPWRDAPPPPPGPTQAELDAYFAQMAPKVKGAIVLVGAPCVPDFVETEHAKRRDDATGAARSTTRIRTRRRPAGRGGNRGGGGGAGRGAAPRRIAGAPARTQQVNTQRVTTS